MAGLLSSGQQRGKGLLSSGYTDPAGYWNDVGASLPFRPGGGIAGDAMSNPPPGTLPQRAWDDYLRWRQGNLEGLQAAAGGDPQAIGDLAAGFVGGLKPEGPGIIAYHASPYHFDRFDMSKIGTGEGAQAYGHGLYMAGHEPVMEGYWRQFQDHPQIRAAQQQIGEIGGQLAELDQRLMQAAPGSQEAKALHDKIRALTQSQKAVILAANPARYQVRINADPATLLDWDKPLSEQSAAVQDVLGPRVTRAINDEVVAGYDRDPMKAKGADAYGAAVSLEPWTSGPRSDQAAVSSSLREAGIPGIQYLDAGSRAAGDGTRNYVIFDDKLIDILKKYGWAPFAGAGAAGAGGLLSSGDGQQ